MIIIASQSSSISSVTFEQNSSPCHRIHTHSSPHHADDDVGHVYIVVVSIAELLSNPQYLITLRNIYSLFNLQLEALCPSPTTGLMIHDLKML